MVFELTMCKSFSSFICTPPFWLTEVARLANFFWPDAIIRSNYRVGSTIRPAYGFIFLAPQPMVRTLYTLDTR